ECLDIRPFDLRVIKVIEVVENRDGSAGLQQTSNHMRADESRATGDKYLHRGKANWPVKMAARNFREPQTILGVLTKCPPAREAARLQAAMARVHFGSERVEAPGAASLQAWRQIVPR